MAAIFFDTNWENALAKKHPKIGKVNRGRFSFRSALGNELLSSWYPGGSAPDVWKAIGKDIVQWNDQGGFNGTDFRKWIYSNQLGWKAGDSVQISLNVNLISGTTPTLRINNTAWQPIFEKKLSPGTNIIEFTVPSNCLDRLYIYNEISNPMNFTLTPSVSGIIPDPVYTAPAQVTQAPAVVMVNPEPEIVTTDPVFVSAATILKEDVINSSIVTEDGTIIGNSANSPIPAPAPEIAKASMLPETLFGLPKKTYLLYGAAAIAGLIIIRKLFK